MDDLVPIAGIIAVFGSPIAIVWLLTRANAKKRELIHSSIDSMIKSGQPIPDDFLDSLTQSTSHPNAHLHKGIILLALGIALSICLLVLAAPKFGLLGLIPSLLGIAYLIIWKLNRKDNDT